MHGSPSNLNSLVHITLAVLLSAVICASAHQTCLRREPGSTSCVHKSMKEMAEQSFIMIKPDGVQRGLVSEIIGRFERRGYKLVAMKLVKPTMQLAEQHYADLSERPFFPALTEFLSSSPVVAMVWSGEDIVVQGRAMIGATNPLKSAPGTIRGDLAIVTGKNIIHGSDSVESAKKEIALWFNEDELCDYEKCTESWIYE